MFAHLVAFSFLFHSAFGCQGTVSGSLIQNPTFTMSFYPPVGWTYFDSTTTPAPLPTAPSTYPGQQGSLAAAQSRMNFDIQSAITIALNQYGLATSGFSYQISGYTPGNVYVVASSSTNAVIGSYVPELGAVTAQRTVLQSGTGTPYLQVKKVLDVKAFQHVTVTTRNTPLYYQSQWRNFATTLFTILNTQLSVYFTSPITVS